MVGNGTSIPRNHVSIFENGTSIPRNHASIFENGTPRQEQPNDIRAPNSPASPARPVIIVRAAVPARPFVSAGTNTPVAGRPRPLQ